MDKPKFSPDSGSSDQIATLSKLLYEKTARDKQDKIKASTRAILSLLGMGTTIAAILIAPKSAYALSKMLQKNDNEWEKWKQFNQQYLRQTLLRLEKQKLVEIKDIAGKQRITINSSGKTKILEYAVEELEITNSKQWDKKWRVVIYDIPNRKKHLQKLMRETLKRLGFLQIQESVYLIPYPCYKEIEFLRQYYFLSEHIKLLIVDKLEDDSAYKAYFGLT